jgi:hypothetical protein
MTRPEEEIRKERDILEKIIKESEKEVGKGPDQNYKEIKLKDYSKIMNGYKNSKEYQAYKNGLMRGKRDALDWVLGEEDDLYLYD